MKALQWSLIGGLLRAKLSGIYQPNLGRQEVLFYVTLQLTYTAMMHVLKWFESFDPRNSVIGGIAVCTLYKKSAINSFDSNGLSIVSTSVTFAKKKNKEKKYSMTSLRMD